MSTPTVIGEGAYGCIHKPSLLCKDAPLLSYKNKVSKIMPKEYAKQELGEYSHIRDIDKSSEYYLGYPTECNVANIPSNIQAIERCENGNELLADLNEATLLVMNDGGINLQEYADKMETVPSTPENKTKIERFFIEFHRIIRAIHMYLKHGILHCDMKPQNIVLSEETGSLNIIDFGLTTTVKSMVSESQKSVNQIAKYHWSYPFEMFFLNQNMYMYFTKMSKEQKEQYYESILRGLMNQPMSSHGGVSLKQSIYNSNTKSIDAIQGFYSYIFDHTTDSEEFVQHMAGFYQTIVIEATIPKYNSFLKKSIHSIDVYGTGITLLYVLKKTKHLLSAKLYKDLFELGYSMVYAQLSKRITVKELLNRYESILTENNIMKKYAKYFKDHKVVDGEPLSLNDKHRTHSTFPRSGVLAIPKRMKTSLNSIQMIDILLNRRELDKIAISINAPKMSIKPIRKKTKKQPIQKGGKKKPCTYKRRH